MNAKQEFLQHIQRIQKLVDTAYENNLFSSEEECSETLGRVIKKYKN